MITIRNICAAVVLIIAMEPLSVASIYFLATRFLTMTIEKTYQEFTTGIKNVSAAMSILHDMQYVFYNPGLK